MSPILLPLLLTASAATSAPQHALPLPPCTRALSLRAFVPHACTCAVAVIADGGADPALSPPSHNQPLHTVTGVSLAGYEAGGALALAVACAPGCAASPTAVPIALPPCGGGDNDAGVLDVGRVIDVRETGGAGGARRAVRVSAGVAATVAAAVQAWCVARLAVAV